MSSFDPFAGVLAQPQVHHIGGHAARHDGERVELEKQLQDRLQQSYVEGESDR